MVDGNSIKTLIEVALYYYLEGKQLDDISDVDTEERLNCLHLFFPISLLFLCLECGCVY